MNETETPERRHFTLVDPDGTPGIGWLTTEAEARRWATLRGNGISGDRLIDSTGRTLGTLVPVGTKLVLR